MLGANPNRNIDKLKEGERKEGGYKWQEKVKENKLRKV